MDTEVLVVGGGLVGLSQALFLRHHGVSVQLVERRTGTSPQPKARRCHVRTMELFREIGLAHTVCDAARGLAAHQAMAAGRTLAEAAPLPLHLPPSSTPVADISPEQPTLIAQDTLEPLLRDAAAGAGADVHFGVALRSFSQDAAGVTAELGDGRTVRAAYLVAADGGRSEVRETLGIARHGPGALGEPNVNVYFNAELGELVRGREFNLCRIDHPEAPGAFASVNGTDRWLFMARGGDTDRDFAALVRTAIGADVPVRVLSALPWRPEMLVAEAYSRGRVHLAGDAAHVMPPFAAAGANTGIADAHNLAWKLAAVLRGADPSLVDTYDTERRPAGWFAADQSSRRSGPLGGEQPAGLAHPLYVAACGAQYHAGALIGGVADGGAAEDVTDFAPRGLVGTRVPHRRLTGSTSGSLSTLDIAGPGWAVLAGGPWSGTELPVHLLPGDFLAPGEALLLRPDHIVAWRGTDPAALTDAHRRITGPNTPRQ